jgi:hypothetical protein
MRPIQIEDGLTMRFPRRSNEFADGVVGGIIAGILSAAAPEQHQARVATQAVQHVGDLARCYGYRVVEGAEDNGMVALTLLRADARPRLRVV